MFCSGPCPAGSYCESGSSLPSPCPAGRFSSQPGATNSSCEGPCLEGHYCPLGSTSNTQIVCGGVDLYCPTGSAYPQLVTAGYYSTGGGPMTRSGQSLAELGFFALDGERHPCPAGSYGSSTGLSANDHFYPAALTSSPQSFPTESPSVQPTNSPTLLTNYPTFAISQLPAPTYEPTTTDQAVRKVFFCSGLCERGYYCPPNSTNSRQEPCPAGRYGASEGLGDMLCTNICPLGHFCELASASPALCPAGRYGSSLGLMTPLCSDPCDAGYYCPSGSLSKDQYECGGPGELPAVYYSHAPIIITSDAAAIKS